MDVEKVLLDLVEKVGEAKGVVLSLSNTTDKRFQEMNEAIGVLGQEIRKAFNAFDEYARRTLPSVIKDDTHRKDGTNGSSVVSEAIAETKLSPSAQRALGIGRWFDMLPMVGGVLKKSIVAIGTVVIAAMLVWGQIRSMKQDALVHRIAIDAGTITDDTPVHESKTNGNATHTKGPN